MHCISVSIELNVRYDTSEREKSVVFLSVNIGHWGKLPMKGHTKWAFRDSVLLPTTLVCIYYHVVAKGTKKIDHGLHFSQVTKQSE